jgi:cardiolipin synthase A/B
LESPSSSTPLVAAERRESEALHSARGLADQAFSRAAGAPLIGGNQVRLLKDAAENYPAWLEAIAAAQHHIHFESYIIHDDEVGERFAAALIDKAQAGVAVRLIYDWMGGLRKTSHAYWNRLRVGGVEVRCYNPPRFDSPLGWVSRDHRKMLSVDGKVAFITGLCVGKAWVGDSERGIAPWRDTGIEVRGPAISAVEHAFAEVWAMLGASLPHDVGQGRIDPAGDVDMRIVATMPATAGIFRLDQLVSALSRERLWLADAYFAGTAPYVQALAAAARDGVDVRLLVPGGTDIPVLRPLSRAGYRPLLDAGVRVFEWNGTMMHAKTAVADGRWARVGSTNLNIASWLGNCELDAVIEDKDFARQMEEMYVADLTNATEVVLQGKYRMRRVPEQPTRRWSRAASGSAGRAAAGAVRLGNALGAALTSRRVLRPLEARFVILGGIVLLGLCILCTFFPRVIAYPAVAAMAWIGLATVYRGLKLLRHKAAD